MFAKSSVIISVRPGNHGRLVTTDLHPRCKSTVAPFDKIIGLWSRMLTSVIFNIRYDCA